VEKRIFRFSKDTIDWGLNENAPLTKKKLGGKGAGLVMMAQAGMPVPPGFTITTGVCNEYRKLNQPDALAHKLDEWVDKLMDEVWDHDTWLGQQFGYAPLVSVRSGAPISMPGMMDTILNVGITGDTLPEWKKRLGERAALDSYRRLIQMLGATAYGVDMALFEAQLTAIKKDAGVKADTELTEFHLTLLIGAYLKVFKAATGEEFPDTRWEQLRAAVMAVFESWMNPRAIEYRKLNKISEDMGTAVNVQAMVFGNMGDDSGTGVLFSRDPSTGAFEMMGEFLQNAQGEDVVAGIRTPVNLAKMFALPAPWPETFSELMTTCSKLEAAYKDMVDVEFTVQQGKLFILQSRTGKRSARAAFKIAIDQVDEGLIDRKTALGRLTPEQFKTVRRPTIDPAFKTKPNVVGLPACPGVVSGKPVFSSEDAVNCTEPCILVTHETSPDDIAGMAKAQGILTATGGATSHAAVVARAMDKACVVGCTNLNIEELKNQKPILPYKPVTKITIDGSTGNVWYNDDVPVIDSSDAPEVRKVMDWCISALNAREVAPVDIGMDRPHRIMAAYWWGSMDVLNAVLDGLAELPSREHISMDVRAPLSFVEPSEAVLTQCFGQAMKGDAFKVVMLGQLHIRAKELQGLTISHAPSDWQLPAGLKAGGKQEMEAVPADYAAFTVLSR
jgi:pyruvate,orthophosphate dikinase